MVEAFSAAKANVEAMEACLEVTADVEATGACREATAAMVRAAVARARAAAATVRAAVAAAAAAVEACWAEAAKAEAKEAEEGCLAVEKVEEGSSEVSQRSGVSSPTAWMLVATSRAATWPEPFGHCKVAGRS